jgi:hypothetical protein
MTNAELADLLEAERGAIRRNAGELRRRLERAGAAALGLERSRGRRNARGDWRRFGSRFEKAAAEPQSSP